MIDERNFFLAERLNYKCLPIVLWKTHLHKIKQLEDVQPDMSIVSSFSPICNKTNISIREPWGYPHNLTWDQREKQKQNQLDLMKSKW